MITAMTLEKTTKLADASPLKDAVKDFNRERSMLAQRLRTVDTEMMGQVEHIRASVLSNGSGVKPVQPSQKKFQLPEAYRHR